MYSKYKDYLEQPHRELKTWKAALYIRLSREDGDKSESYSITSQREILKEYLKLHPDIEAHDFYVDDGWSGTSFDRPGFVRMMEDIYAGTVNCVITECNDGRINDIRGLHVTEENVTDAIAAADVDFEEQQITKELLKSASGEF